MIERDSAHCPNCGGKLKIIASILEPPVIEKILMLLRLQARTSDCFATTNSRR